MEIIFIAIAIACSLGAGGASFQILHRPKKNKKKPKHTISSPYRVSESQDGISITENKDFSYTDSNDVHGILRKLRKWISIADRTSLQERHELYSDGISEFDRLQIDKENYFSALVQSKERVVLDMCQSTEGEDECCTLVTRKRLPVRYHARVRDSTQFDISCAFLSLNRPFSVQGFNGRKLPGLDLIQGPAWRYYDLSTIVNSPLALSISCQCGLSRPAEPATDPTKQMTATIVFRLAWYISKFLPCPCGEDERVTKGEAFDMYCRAVYCVCQRLEDIYASFSGDEAQEYSTTSHAGIHMRCSRLDRRFNISGTNPSSFGKAMHMVSQMYETFLLSVVSNSEIERTVIQGLGIQTRSYDKIERICAKLTEKHDAESSLNWLCFNKWNSEIVKSVSTHKLPLHTEIKRALRFMDSASVTFLGKMTTAQLKPARISFGRERLEWVSFSGDKPNELLMMKKPQFCTNQDIFCVGRPRLKEAITKKMKQMTFTDKGKTISIAISDEGAVLTFFRLTGNVRKVLKNVVMLNMMESGMGFDLSRVLGKDLYKDDFVFVNEALSMKYGDSVFEFVVSNIISGRIAVQRNSTAASYVPKASKKLKGVVLNTPVKGEFWKDKYFFLTERHLYWLPGDGFNYFKVERQTGDGLFAMKEVYLLDSPPKCKCSAVLDTPVR